MTYYDRFDSEQFYIFSIPRKFQIKNRFPLSKNALGINLWCEKKKSPLKKGGQYKIFIKKKKMRTEYICTENNRNTFRWNTFGIHLDDICSIVFIQNVFCCSFLVRKFDFGLREFS